METQHRPKPLSHLQHLLAALLLIASIGWLATKVLADEPTKESLLAQIAREATDDARANIPPVYEDLYRAYRGKAGLTDSEIRKTYREAYLDAKAKVKSGPFDPLIPNLGWIAAILVGCWALFRKAIEQAVLDGINVIKRRIHVQYAGSSRFRRFAVRCYRQSLILKYSRLRVPFRSDRHMDMRQVYVPLRAKQGEVKTPVEISDALSSHRRLIVLGSPGAGKSMLMRRVALDYAEGRLDHLEYGITTILLELHRLNGSSLTIQQHLSDELKRNDFPNAKVFVDQNLKDGKLLLLFDGLDEVSSRAEPGTASERDRVVREIADLLTQFEQCRAIITCRSAVYRDEFLQTCDRCFEIDEFTDEQIRRFLRLWWNVHSDQSDSRLNQKSIEQLIQTLEDRPSIKLLSRNPLLLTIIAYLYTNTPLVLPHSRADFYRRATDVLLETLDELRQLPNRFEARSKKIALQYLAFQHFKNTSSDDPDRKSLNHDTVIEQLRTLLPDLNLKSDEALSVLDEIVERSGLLIRIDGGERYQFAHLTLQEYFAAAALLGDEMQLVELFKSDHDTWREVVKLWCGLSSNSTVLLSEIHEEDPLTAFECLADAQAVAPELSARIIKAFEIEMCECIAAEPVWKAFGAVAAATNPRGSEAFAFLLRLLETKGPSAAQFQSSAAYALSYTNLPRAAKELAKYMAIPLVREALLRMGDLAVPALESQLSIDPIQAMDGLIEIGTPMAASALVPLLWNEDDRICSAAAWRLGELLADTSVEAVLAEFHLDERQRTSAGSPWVLQPFLKNGDSSYAVIASRVAHCIENSDESSAPSNVRPLDPRVAVGLCTLVTLDPSINPFSDEIKRDVFTTLQGHDGSPGELLQSVTEGELEPHQLVPLLNAVRERGNLGLCSDLMMTQTTVPNLGGKWTRLMECIPEILRLDLCIRMIGEPKPTKMDWINLFKPQKFEMEGSWIQSVVATLVILIHIIGSAAWAVDISNKGQWLTWWGLVFGICLIWNTVLMLILKDQWKDPLFWVVFSGPVGFSFFISRGNWQGAVSVFKGLIQFCFPSCVLWFSTVTFTTHYFGLLNSLILWILIHCVSGWLLVSGFRRERESRNPLKGILPLDGFRAEVSGVYERETGFSTNLRRNIDAVCK
jgi:hypothetical protein